LTRQFTYNPWFLFCQYEYAACPPHFCDSFSNGKESLWPGSPAFGGIAWKKHRPSYFGLRISDFGFFGFSFSIRIPQSAFRNLEAGPWAIHRIAPTRIQPEDVVLALFPPGPRNGMCLMIFLPNSLASGPGKASNLWSFI